MERQEKFGDLEVVFKKLKLQASKPLLPKIGAAMIRLAASDAGFFGAFSAEDIEKLIEILCQSSEKINENGERRPLLLIDLNDKVEWVLPMLVAFLEYNFSFFTRALELLDRIVPRVSSTSKSV